MRFVLAFALTGCVVSTSRVPLVRSLRVEGDTLHVEVCDMVWNRELKTWHDRSDDMDVENCSTHVESLNQ